MKQYKPIEPPTEKDARYKTIKDVSIVVPTVSPPESLVESLVSWFRNEPLEVILVTIPRDLPAVQQLVAKFKKIAYRLAIEEGRQMPPEILQAVPERDRHVFATSNENKVLRPHPFIQFMCDPEAKLRILTHPEPTKRGQMATGIRATKGKFIALCDDDVLWHPSGQLLRWLLAPFQPAPGNTEKRFVLGNTSFNVAATGGPIQPLIPQNRRDPRVATA